MKVSKNIVKIETKFKKYNLLNCVAKKTPLQHCLIFALGGTESVMKTLQKMRHSKDSTSTSTSPKCFVNYELIKDKN